MDQAAIVTQTTPGSPGTQDYTSGSITETVKAAILLFGHSTTDGANTAHAAIGIGFWANDGDAGSESFGGVYGLALNGRTTTTFSRDFQGLNEIVTAELDATPLIDVDITAISAISGGIRITFSTTSATIKLTVVILAGLSRAYHSAIATTTTLTHENAGSTTQFRPDCLVLFGCESGFALPKDDLNIALGFKIDGGSQVGAGIKIEDGTDPTDADGRVDSDNCAYINPVADALQATTHTIDATGYDHQLTTGTGSPDTGVLCLKFSGDVQLAADNVAIAASGASQSISVGFQPILVIGMATLLAAEDTTTSDSTVSAVGLFAFTSSAARAYTASHQIQAVINASTPSVATSRQDDKALLMLDHTGTVVWEATATMTSTGFDLSFSTRTSAGFITFLAIGAGNLTSILAETERISDGTFLNLVKYLSLTETVRIVDGLGGTILADGLSFLGPRGFVFQPRVEVGEVAQVGSQQGLVFRSLAEAGEVVQPSAEAGAVGSG